MLVRDSEAEDLTAPCSDSWPTECTLFYVTAFVVVCFTVIDKYYSGFLSQVRTSLLENHFREKHVVVTEPLLSWNITDIYQEKELQNHSQSLFIPPIPGASLLEDIGRIF